MRSLGTIIGLPSPCHSTRIGIAQVCVCIPFSYFGPLFVQSIYVLYVLYVYRLFHVLLFVFPSRSPFFLYFFSLADG